MRRVAIWAPLAVFALFVVVALLGLSRGARTPHASQMIGKPFPQVTLPAAASSRPSFTSPTPGARLVNVFGSWCVPCVAEARTLALLQARGATLDGIAIRDRVADVDRFLEDHGNPFRQIGLDSESRVQFAIGSSGVPETFVVDARGIIRHQHIGALTPEDVPALLDKLRQAR